MKKGFIYSVNQKHFITNSFSNIVIPDKGGFIFQPILFDDVPDDCELLELGDMMNISPWVELFVNVGIKWFKVTYFDGGPSL